MNRDLDALPNPTRSAIRPTIFRGLLWFTLLGALWAMVPRAERIFKEFDVELPVTTQWVIGASHHLLLILTFVAVLCTVDFAVLRIFSRHPRAVVRRWLWGAIMILSPLALMAWAAMAIYLPLSSLIRNLTGG